MATMMTFVFWRHLAVAAGASLFFCTSAGGQTTVDPMAAFEGRWVWSGNRDKLGPQKACSERWTQFQISADKREITYRYQLEAGGEKSGTYNVLYQDGNSIAMYLNKEERKVRNGDRVVWIAVVVDKDTFTWRIHGLSSNLTEMIYLRRVRCPAS
jgi:hypothetical protein